MISLLAIAAQAAAAMPMLQEGRFAEARPVLQKACEANEPNGCYLLGRTLLALDRYAEAIQTLKPLAKTDDAPWRVEDALGLAHEALRDAAAAEQYYRTALKGNGGRTPEPAHHFGRFLVREGRAQEAIAILRPAAQKFPPNEPIRFELGRALYQTNQLEQAEIELASAPSLLEARRLLEKVRRQRRD